MKDYISLVGLILEDTNNDIKTICLRNNTDLKLSERFFNFPLHVSFKRTFITDNFNEVKDDVKDYFKNKGKIYAGKTTLVMNKDMLWLTLNDSNNLIEMHNELDEMLLEKYNIQIDYYDKNYVPHITIFHDDDIDKLKIMYERLNNALDDLDIYIDRCFYGIRNKDEEIFDI